MTLPARLSSVTGPPRVLPDYLVIDNCLGGDDQSAGRAGELHILHQRAVNLGVPEPVAAMDVHQDNVRVACW